VADAVLEVVLRRDRIVVMTALAVITALASLSPTLASVRAQSDGVSD
jgi:hypothetical protein